MIHAHRYHSILLTHTRGIDVSQLLDMLLVSVRLSKELSEARRHGGRWSVGAGNMLNVNRYMMRLGLTT